MKGKLILEDGSTFTGNLLDDRLATGEVVFNTGMTGYQEILTDPSYCSQIITLTYPLIGNYGTAEKFNQSRKCFANGLVIGELCEAGSNWQKENELAQFLEDNQIPCLYNVDTRALTRCLRSSGTMKGIIVCEDTPKAECEKLMALPIDKKTVKKVTTPEQYVLDNKGMHIVVMDFGIKRHMLESMHERGCKITVVPAYTTSEAVLALKPDGIFLSNGPGDPKDVMDIVETIKQLIGKKPIFGICLGHQLIALASGADTYKLKFGHRGSNQPVKDLRTGRVYISSQNHGYAVNKKSLEKLPFVITHISMNDGTIEGIHHKSLPLFSVQYHPEASPGPDDNTYLFDEFCAMMKKGAN
ncbi:carbamoyl phosphate synthase small subunit [Pectinatus sottacetonis]|uniref:carbamoyl phosphate synthase small subunit n=1 Tax=Pectinatus sottacetonis TaxID=1002795 RepID=UPI0018C78A80|nr:carbamoyl phosphate synthase small subunit [Pectinatus sottacetonis]